MKKILGDLIGLLIAGLLITVVVISQKNKPPENNVDTEILKRSHRSEIENMIDSIRAREEKIILDTIITRFGNHPGSNSYDTTYELSYETKNVLKANRLKQTLQKTNAKQ